MSETVRPFAWNDIGNIELGRPAIGDKMHVSVYRMFYYSLANIIEKNCGKEAAKHMLVEAGQNAGREFCRHVLNPGLPPEDFFDLFKQKALELGMGLLEVEHADYVNMIFILTVSEDLECSGVSPTGETVCHYDEGLIMGILEVFMGRQFVVKETDCWSTGSWTCRFHVVAI